jgi:hypothetical protein
MPVRLAGEIQRVGIKLPGVAMGRRARRRPFRDCCAGDRDVLAREALRRGHERALVSQELLDGGLDPRSPRAELLHLHGMSHQGERAVADQVDRRLVPGDQEKEDHREQLVLVELVAGFLGLREGADQVVARLGAPRADEPPDVSQKEDGGRTAFSIPAPEGLRPRSPSTMVELVAILNGHAEHLRDDRRRHRKRVIPDRRAPRRTAASRSSS